MDYKHTIGLIAVDSNYPNLALMKISAFYKAQGDLVEWYTPYQHYDMVYMSKVFTFTPNYDMVINNADQIVRGGTGYDITKTLPAHIDRLQPDYDLYNIDKNLAYGFLTRGCPNHCKWCIVPKKEGNVRPYMDIEEVANGRHKIILMDNNILASDYGLSQIEKIVKLGLHVDFNQALDARLVTDEIAAWLAKVHWLNYIRFGCDTPGQIGEVERAINLINKHGYTREYFLYCILLNDFAESFSRVNHWRNYLNAKVTVFAQPYRDFSRKNTIPLWQQDLARWSNRKELFKSCEFKDYMPRKGFICRQYFDL